MSAFLFEISMCTGLTNFVAGAIIVFLGFYVKHVLWTWEEYISGHRVNRANTKCPSYKNRPNTRFDDVEVRISENCEHHEEFLRRQSIEKRNNRKRRNSSHSSIHLEKAIGNAFVEFPEIPETETANELDMDHVYIGFLDFLWGFIFIAPMSFFLWKMGTLRLIMRQYLVEKGISEVEKVDIEALVGDLCLEQSQVINYAAKTKKNSILGNIARFVFSDFPYIDNDCNFQVAGLFVVHINLDSRRFAGAKMDGAKLEASDVLILLWFNTITAQHVKLHAMANWGINEHQSLAETNPFLQRNSVVTAMYNFFGYSMFQNFLVVWEKQGLLTKNWSKTGALIQCFDHGIKKGVASHTNVTDLARYSRFVNFTVKVRGTFIKEFAKHRDLFPGIDVEALFVGTVLHSLDHTMMEWNLRDPLWLDVNNEKFGKMAELGRIVRAGFVEDVPFLYFNRRFKGSMHPFYRSVYQKAAKIDQELADHMDTCIVK